MFVENNISADEVNDLLKKQIERNFVLELTRENIYIFHSHIDAQRIVLQELVEIGQSEQRCRTVNNK